MAKLTYAQVDEVLKCDPERGLLFWKERPQRMFSTKRSCSIWNARYALKEAFTAFRYDGYRFGNLFNRPHRAHRVIWLLSTGEWPVDQIDHIDGNRANNRIVNLREVTNAQNGKNCARRSDNASGVTGISWAARDKKWVAQIRAEGKTECLGYFSDKNEAIAARHAAEVLLGFHPNHGRPS